MIIPGKIRSKTTGMAAGAVLFAGCLAMPARAQENNRSPAASQAPRVSFAVTMENKPDLALGEPIVLHYTINNLTNFAVATPLGKHGGVWYTLTLVRSSDSEKTGSLPLLRELPHLDFGGFQITYNFIQPGQKVEGFIIVNQRFDLTQTGTYTLTLAVDMPYDFWHNRPGELIDTNVKGLRPSGLALRNTYIYPLTVRAAAPDELARTAYRLRKRFLASPDKDEKSRVAAALFSMPTLPGVLTEWKRLAYGSGLLDRKPLAYALGQTYTIEAADVLVRMEFGHPVRDDAGNPVSILRTLSAMKYLGSPKLRSHINKLLAPYRIDPREMSLPLD